MSTNQDPDPPRDSLNSAETTTGLGLSPAQRGLVGRGRPVWVVVVAVLYALAFCTAVISLALANSREQGASFVWGLVLIAVILLTQGALLRVPVRFASRRPFRRGALWVPLVFSGLLFGALVMAVGMCVAALLSQRAPDKLVAIVYWLALALAVLSWLGWVVVFYRMSASRQPEEVGFGLHRVLLKGSVLELLVALPAHIIERQRDECSANVMTFFGVCTGLSVMFLAFGPSVFILYLRRCMNLQPPSAESLSPEQQRRRVLKWAVLAGLVVALLLFLVLWVGLLPDTRGLLRD